MQSDAHRSELLTVKELAREWRQHPASIYRKISDGTIPSVRLGDGTSALRIPRAELDAQIHRSGGSSSASTRPSNPAERVGERLARADGPRRGSRGEEP
jgi:excisionase family DNA binding protein